MSRQKTSPWLTYGCGCCALGCLGMLFVASVGMYGFSSIKDYFTELADPVAREQRALAMLGTDSLPQGYTTQNFFGIPGIFDAVMLNDSKAALEATPDDLAPALGEHVFTFVSIWSPGKEAIDPFSNDPNRDVRIDVGIQIEPWEDLGQGVWKIPGGQIVYSAHKGELRGPSGDWYRGIYSKMRIDCQQGKRARSAVWFYQVPIDKSDDTKSDPASLAATNTPADETTLRAFMSHFSLCPS